MNNDLETTDIEAVKKDGSCFKYLARRKKNRRI